MPECVMGKCWVDESAPHDATGCVCDCHKKEPVKPAAEPEQNSKIDKEPS